MPFQISVTLLEIASSAVLIRICMACQMVSNRYRKDYSNGEIVS